MSANAGTPWLTPTEAADYLGVALGTLRNWVSRSYVPFARRGRVVRFHRDRLDAWLTQGAENHGGASKLLSCSKGGSSKKKVGPARII